MNTSRFLCFSLLLLTLNLSCQRREDNSSSVKVSDTAEKPAQAVTLEENSLDLGPIKKDKGEDEREYFNKLSSIEIDEATAIDRDEAWSFLRISAQDGLFTSTQYRRSTELIQEYRNAAQIDKLVIWAVIQTRFKQASFKGVVRIGSDLEEMLLKRALSNFLLTSFGNGYDQLIESADPMRSGYTGPEAAELQRVYQLQEKEALRILQSEMSSVR